MTEKKKGIDLKKLMEAGALLAESRARGSSGNIASKLREANVDLSGKDDGGTSTPPKSGASNGAKNVDSFNEQNTNDTAGKRFGGQGNKRRNQDPYEDMK